MKELAEVASKLVTSVLLDEIYELRKTIDEQTQDMETKDLQIARLKLLNEHDYKVNVEQVLEENKKLKYDIKRANENNRRRGLWKSKQ